ncbi:MAG: hypothetical protein OEW29_00990 [Acidimicrobiia bacterium]|nr:hypothetical protein [Acidimicrobiia bacterium]MDH4363895.1 hypothetical protein [Acidimicrobiia bacterium]
MSIPVPLEDLAAEVARRGPGYLLTAAGGSRPHLLQLRFEVTAGADGVELRAPVSRTATRNIEAQPAVTLLWSPLEDGHSLVVDAVAAIERPAADGAEAVAVLTAVKALLHRPA